MMNKVQISDFENTFHKNLSIEILRSDELAQSLRNDDYSKYYF